MFVPHLLNLIVRSLIEFPTVLSSNWLSILLPLVFFLIKENKSLWSNWPHMNPKVVKDSKPLFFIYAALLAWAMCKTVYDDHVYFVEKAASLKRATQLDQTNSAGIEKEKDIQYQALQVSCAGIAGEGKVLQSQNRDQQTTINNCQTQALKLLAPEPKMLKSLILFKDRLDSQRKYLWDDWIIVSNKTLAPVTVVSTCEKGEIYEMHVNPLSENSMTMSELFAGSLSPNSYKVVLKSPQLAPFAPALVSVAHSYLNANCDIKVGE